MMLSAAFISLISTWFRNYYSDVVSFGDNWRRDRNNIPMDGTERAGRSACLKNTEPGRSEPAAGRRVKKTRNRDGTFRATRNTPLTARRPARSSARIYNRGP